MALGLLDGTPDWDRFRPDSKTPRGGVLRLRQKVVVPTLLTAGPRAGRRDPDFNLDFHVSCVSGPATLRDLEWICSRRWTYRARCGRPPWWRVWLAERRCCCNVSHAVTDGVGGGRYRADL